MSEGHFERLDADECLQLLRDARIGRVVFDGPDGLTVIPLAYVVDGRRVVLRTAEGTQLSALRDGAAVAFEVDEFDEEFADGWSVLARGSIARIPTGADDLAEVPSPFVPGERGVLMAISLDSLTGRAVSAAG